jgi:hypothetical protein
MNETEDAMRCRGGFFLTLLMALPLLISGCASTLRSEVTAFHQWPADAAGRSFAFLHRDGEAPNLERQTYENLVRAQLLKLGLRDAASGEAAALSVRMDYSISARDVRVVETVLVDAWTGTPWYGPGFYNPYWGRPGYHPYFYGPMWPSMPVAREQERRFTVFHRELKIKISEAASDQPWYDVTVKSAGERGNLAALMPYLAEAAFKDFPGANGVPRVIEMKIK